ncbi:MAG: hypothetical protein IJ143_10800 [Neisseriaceae bacterium]|nr:hypothetical protein [Neisseriaceae bacterium]
MMNTNEKITGDSLMPIDATFIATNTLNSAFNTQKWIKNFHLFIIKFSEDYQSIMDNNRNIKKQFFRNIPYLSKKKKLVKKIMKYSSYFVLSEDNEKYINDIMQVLKLKCTTPQMKMQYDEQEKILLILFDKQDERL